MLFGSAGAYSQSRPALLRMVGQTVSATIDSVADGDTVRARLDGGGRTLTIRLEGIDAPEQGELFSTQARRRERQG
jgi:endonuclease YncB( thermonuclease family)